MTKEQETIKYIETRIKICNENADICDDNNFDEEATYLREESYMLETVLNMLKEKDELYHKALGDLVKADRENIQLNKQIDLMAEQIKISEPTMKIESFDIKPKTKFSMRYLNKEEVKQYFERKAENGRD